MRSQWTQRAPLSALRVFPGSRSLFFRALLSSALLVLVLTSHAAAAARFYTVSPCRVLDTRGALGTFAGPALAPGATRSFFLAPNPTQAGQCGISPTASAISANVTVTQPTAPGFLLIYPSGSAPPPTSTINFRSGQTRANNAILPLGTGGGIVVALGQVSGTAHFLLDINGYFDNPANNQPPTASVGGDQSITLPASANLTGSASDDGKPSPPGVLTYAWTKVGGPGTVTFGSGMSLSTTASFSEAGIYGLRLTVSDSQISASDDVTIYVNPPAGANPSADLTRFLEQATWGPTSADLAHLQAKGIAAWLDEQFNMPASSYPTLPLQPTTVPVLCAATCQRDNYTMYPLQNRFFINAMYGPDQLRQRVAFALHELVVVSGNTITQPSWMAPYLQIFDRNAFGSYRQILYEATLNPGMGVYLDMATNNSPTNPNENYAREIMQLFSVGLYMLNLDGTPQLDVVGEPIPSYDQSQVTGLAHLFTGWSLASNITSGGSCSAASPCPDYITPMPFNLARHDVGSKTIVSGIVVPAGQTGDQDLNQAIDALFYHPNVGPYLATHLIHNLVTSNPTPGYVQRVAETFDNNGVGQRGDMKAVIAAVLLDPEARGDVITTPEYGHLKNPVLLLTNLLRAFNAKSASLSTTSDGVLNPQALSMSMDVFRPPTVFSYYPAEFEIPGWSPLLGPEFGIFSATEALKRANVINTLVFSTIPVSANAPNGTALDFSSWLPLASNPTQLVSQLNNSLMHGSMSASMQTSIVNAVNAVAVTNPLLRVQQAVYLVATSSQYQVER